MKRARKHMNAEEPLGLRANPHRYNNKTFPVELKRKICAKCEILWIKVPDATNIRHLILIR